MLFVPDISTMEYVDDVGQGIDIILFSVENVGQRKAVSQPTLGIFYAISPR